MFLTLFTKRLIVEWISFWNIRHYCKSINYLYEWFKDGFVSAVFSVYKDICKGYFLDFKAWRQLFVFFQAELFSVVEYIINGYYQPIILLASLITHKLLSLFARRNNNTNACLLLFYFYILLCDYYFLFNHYFVR